MELRPVDRHKRCDSSTGSGTVSYPSTFPSPPPPLLDVLMVLLRVNLLRRKLFGYPGGMNTALLESPCFQSSSFSVTVIILGGLRTRAQLPPPPHPVQKKRIHFTLHFRAKHGPRCCEANEGPNSVPT